MQSLRDKFGRKKTAVIGLLILMSAFFLMYLAVHWLWNERQPVKLSDFTFEVTGSGQSASLKLWHNYYDGKEYLFLPSFCKKEANCLILQENRAGKSWDGKKIGSMAAPFLLTDGEHILHSGNTDFKVVVMRSDKVPALFISTQSGNLTYIEAEKGNGEPGVYSMVGSDGTELAEGRLNELRSRGNITFLEDKKPYQMTLREPADLLGGGVAKNYILLANREDQSLLRDKIMYDMAVDMGVKYSPKSDFVDLYVNNEYRGSYLLSEKVEVGKNRVEIDAKTAGADGETGFLIELDYAVRLEEAEHYFVTANNQGVVIKRPSNPSEENEQYMEQLFQQAEDAIRQNRLDEAPIDLNSFAKKYLLEEIGKNLDAMYSSQFFYKSAGEKIFYAGPGWDYDKTLGNPGIERNRPVNFQEPRGIYAASLREDASWWYDLYQCQTFRDEVNKEYEKTAIPVIQNILDKKLDTYQNEVWDSAAMDYLRWDTFEDFKNAEPLEFEQEYKEQIELIRSFLSARMEFFNDIWIEGRTYGKITCDPVDGTMYVTFVDAIEGRVPVAPAEPKKEGFRFDHWIREDTGEVYDFTESYDGEPFTLRAEYVVKTEGIVVKT